MDSILHHPFPKVDHHAQFASRQAQVCQRLGFKDGVVSVVLRGACSGCPSSTVTLKNGIEALLKNRLPGEVTEVVAING